MCLTDLLYSVSNQILLAVCFFRGRFFCNVGQPCVSVVATVLLVGFLCLEALLKKTSGLSMLDHWAALCGTSSGAILRARRERTPPQTLRTLLAR